jgi:hypothetical protein
MPNSENMNIDTALAKLEGAQKGGSITNGDLSEIAAVIRGSDALAPELKGASYLKDFGEKYNPTFGTNVALAIAKSVSASADPSNKTPGERLMDVARNIASGADHSISESPPKFGWTLSTNIGVMMNHAGGDEKSESGAFRTTNGTSDFIKANKPEGADPSVEMNVLKKFPALMAVVAKGSSTKVAEQDMISIIGNGSSKGDNGKNVAGLYVEGDAMESQVKEKIAGFIKAGTLNGKEAQSYLHEKNKEVAQYGVEVYSATKNDEMLKVANTYLRNAKQMSAQYTAAISNPPDAVAPSVRPAAPPQGPPTPKASPRPATPSPFSLDINKPPEKPVTMQVSEALWKDKGLGGLKNALDILMKKSEYITYQGDEKSVPDNQPNQKASVLRQTIKNMHKLVGFAEEQKATLNPETIETITKAIQNNGLAACVENHLEAQDILGSRNLNDSGRRDAARTTDAAGRALGNLAGSISTIKKEVAGAVATARVKKFTQDHPPQNHGTGSLKPEGGRTAQAPNQSQSAGRNS